MKVEDILGKRCFLYVKDIIDIYNMQQEREKAVLTKVFGHLHLINGNKFVFYFNWIKELNNKDMLYQYGRSIKSLPHGYNSFIELPGWKVCNSLAFLDNPKVFSITEEELKELLDLPQDTLIQVHGKSCMGAMGYTDRENYFKLFEPLSKRIINI
jgi:hypothetical protein